MFADWNALKSATHFLLPINEFNSHVNNAKFAVSDHLPTTQKLFFTHIWHNLYAFYLHYATDLFRY